MKRRITALLMLLILIPTMLFAVLPSDKEYETDGSHSFQPYSLMSPRVIGMGGAGLALNGTFENRLMNPANTSSVFGLYAPYVSVSVYNLKNNNDNLHDIAVNNGMLTLYDAAFSFLNTIPGGERNFLSIDLGAGFSYQNLSMFSFMNADVFTVGEGDLSSNLGIDMDAGLITTLSYSYEFGNDYGISAGLSIGFMMKNITASSTELSGIGVSFVSNIMEEFQYSPEDFGTAIFNALDDIPLSIGTALPISIGTRVDFPYGFSLAMALNNINGSYNMTIKDDSYTIDVPMTLDFGFAWNLDIGDFWYYLLEPSVAIDLVDMVGMFEEGLGEKGVFIDHLKMGAELNFLTVFNARLGLDRGYFTFGFGMDMYALNVDISYGVRPYGPSREGRYLDYVKLRVNVGFDRP